MTLKVAIIIFIYLIGYIRCYIKFKKERCEYLHQDNNEWTIAHRIDALVFSTLSWVGVMLLWIYHNGDKKAKW